METTTLGIENSPVTVGRGAGAVRWRRWTGARARVVLGLAVVASVDGCGDGGCGDAPGPGNLVLSIAALPATSNCKSPTEQGAAITTSVITLVHTTSNTCAPVTFIRARGTTQLGTYTISCSSPAVAACIETDETLTWPNPEPGRYTVHVAGRVGALDCWKNDDTFDVPSSGLVRTLTLAHQNTPGC